MLAKSRMIARDGMLEHFIYGLRYGPVVARSARCRSALGHRREQQDDGRGQERQNLAAEV